MLIGIVADDLTGAADAVAPFARRGLSADVACVFGGQLAAEMPPGDARAWDTETRELPPERSIAISHLTRAATRRLKAFDPLLFYKKIDSTLRGHLRLELDAMRRELPDRLAVICPAFPANGRTVENGIVRVHSKPLQVSIREAFEAALDSDTMELPLSVIRQGVEIVRGHLDRMIAQGISTVFCDAVIPSDLEVLAQAILLSPSRYLPVGSAGLSSALAEVGGMNSSAGSLRLPVLRTEPHPSARACPLPYSNTKRIELTQDSSEGRAAQRAPSGGIHSADSQSGFLSPPLVRGDGSGGIQSADYQQGLPSPNSGRGVGVRAAAPDIFTTGRILVVVGSLNPVSRRQAFYLAERAGTQAAVLEMNPPPRWRSNWKRYEEAIHGTLSQWTSEQRIGLLITPENSAIPHAEKSIYSAAAWFLYGQNLLYRQDQIIEGYIFTGGDTAIQFLQFFGTRGIQIQAEIAPGIVCGTIVTDNERFHGLPIITKAGGFGTEETLARCVGLA